MLKQESVQLCGNRHLFFTILYRDVNFLESFVYKYFYYASHIKKIF